MIICRCRQVNIFRHKTYGNYFTICIDFSHNDNDKNEIINTLHYYNYEHVYNVRHSLLKRSFNMNECVITTSM